VNSRQLDYIRHRTEGKPPTKAALLAGYAEKSAAVTASRMESMPGVILALAQAKAPAPPTSSAPPASGTSDPMSAEDYLTRVVSGEEPPDPLRISAAKALIAYQQARRRHPVPSPPPKVQEKRDLHAITAGEAAEWEAKAAEVRARHNRTTKGQP